MAGIKNSPFESSFETLSGQVAGAVKQTAKKAGQAVSGVANDAAVQAGLKTPAKENQGKAQTGGGGWLEQLGVKAVPEAQKQEVKATQEQLLAQTRQNLNKLNEEIAQVRKAKVEKEKKKGQEEVAKKQQKQAVEQKKAEEPIWKKMLKGSQGAHEGNKHISG